MKVKEKDIASLCRTLGNSRRLAILAHLKRRKEADVGDIASHLKLSFKATSRHLRALLIVDIVERDQRGLMAFYKLAPSANIIVRNVINSL